MTLYALENKIAVGQKWVRRRGGKEVTVVSIAGRFAEVSGVRSSGHSHRWRVLRSTLVSYYWCPSLEAQR